jgi:hypothetical protein
MTRAEYTEWTEKNNARPTRNLRPAANQLRLAVKKAAVWEHRMRPRLRANLEHALAIVDSAIEELDEAFPLPLPEGGIEK